MLQEQIAVTQARIEELEKPQTGRSNFVLNNDQLARQRRPASPTHVRRGSSMRSQRPIPPSMPTSSSEGIPTAELEPLIHNFLRHSSQFGFFLNVHNFREAMMGRRGQRPAAVLIDVVNLCAIHLSGLVEFTTQEPRYLSRALRTAVDAVSATQGNGILHRIQAEVLLAHYFLRNTRSLEGNYHLSAAVSLIISSGMHRIRSAEPAVGVAFTALAPPRDPIEEVERINAFWTVLTLNNCWTTADGSPSNISYTDSNTRIDTPWPLDINAPLHDQILPDSGFGTVNGFLANLPDGGVSLAAFHAKAALLFEQASRLASQYHPNMNNIHQFYASFNSIDTLIERFKRSLPTVHSREMLVIHSLAHVATIQLHNPFAADNNNSRVRALDSARAIVAALAQVPGNAGYIDLIMGTLLMATCQVFVAELGRYRCRRPINSPLTQEERSLMNAIETVLAVMNVFAQTCQLINSQLLAMQQLYHGLN
ncbi:Fungal-trans domain-containing protein [Mycena venus]|uniref:Fungal-trans domain-containing protein n=1 Tax=Mycena venus TaxID=2733690 RepID=A0A8H6YR61_9AGAR|nr:Fungal-trans domain-containing protein [Mycena venus]